MGAGDLPLPLDARWGTAMNLEASASTLLRRGNSPARLEIVPSGRRLGAEIRGVDLSLPIPPALAWAIRRAWLDHLVVVFRDQKLTPEQFLDAARIFGTPEPGSPRKPCDKHSVRSSAHAAWPQISIVSNLAEKGHPAERGSFGSMEVVWHSDHAQAERPSAGTCLHAIEVPMQGGNTSFNNQYLAYETLPADLKRAIRGRRSVQDAPSGPSHPLVRLHPETGKPALYLGCRRAYPSQCIQGLAEAESEMLLDRLWAHATQDKFKWTHGWKVGDLVVWDNRCTMHYRTPVDATQRRVMWRTQYQGEEVIPA